MRSGERRREMGRKEGSRGRKERGVKGRGKEEEEEEEGEVEGEGEGGRSLEVIEFSEVMGWMGSCGFFGVLWSEMLKRGVDEL